MYLITAYLNAGVIPVVTVNVAIGVYASLIPHLHTSFAPISPSLMHQALWFLRTMAPGLLTYLACAVVHWQMAVVLNVATAVN